MRWVSFIKQKNMLYVESDKAHISGSCFLANQLENALSSGFLLFGQQELASASASLKTVRQVVFVSVQNAEGTLLQGWIYPCPQEDLEISGWNHISWSGCAQSSLHHWQLLCHGADWRSLINNLWAFVYSALLLKEQLYRYKRAL